MPPCRGACRGSDLAAGRHGPVPAASRLAALAGRRGPGHQCGRHPARAAWAVLRRAACPGTGSPFRSLRAGWRAPGDSALRPRCAPGCPNHLLAQQGRWRCRATDQWGGLGHRAALARVCGRGRQQCAIPAPGRRPLLAAARRSRRGAADTSRRPDRAARRAGQGPEPWGAHHRRRRPAAAALRRLSAGPAPRHGSRAGPGVPAARSPGAGRQLPRAISARQSAQPG